MKLEKRLRVYENPHTPSSQRRFKGEGEDTTLRGKRGAPKGHRGATCKTPEYYPRVSSPVFPRSESD